MRRREGELRRFLAAAWLIFAKDLRAEWRSREVVYTTTLFAVLLAVVFSFAFFRSGRPMPHVAGGLLWVSVAFSGILALGRVYQREQKDETLTALLLTPASRGAIYLGKLLGSVLFMGLAVALVTPLIIALFELQPGSPALLALLLLLGVLGFAEVGSLFAATLSRAGGGREVLLGILTYPIVTPVLVAGAKGSAALLAATPDLHAAMVWLRLLAVFDVVFLVLALWAFGPLVQSE